MDPHETITAVIVTFNNPGMLRDLLEDLRRQSLEPYRIIVVDNSTRCGSNPLPGALRGIDYLKMARNEGSAGGFHEGLRLALDGADAILTLDDDGCPRCPGIPLSGPQGSRGDAQTSGRRAPVGEPPRRRPAHRASPGGGCHTGSRAAAGATEGLLPLRR